MRWMLLEDTEPHPDVLTVFSRAVLVASGPVRLHGGSVTLASFSPAWRSLPARAPGALTAPMGSSTRPPRTPGRFHSHRRVTRGAVATPSTHEHEELRSWGCAGAPRYTAALSIRARSGLGPQPAVRGAVPGGAGQPREDAVRW